MAVYLEKDGARIQEIRGSDNTKVLKGLKFESFGFTFGRKHLDPKEGVRIRFEGGYSILVERDEEKEKEE